MLSQPALSMIFVILVWTVKPSDAVEVNCAEVEASGCACESACDFDGPRVTCPSYGLKYEISRLSLQHHGRPPLVQITCLNLTEPEDLALRVPPGLHFSRTGAHAVWWRDCPLPESPLAELLTEVSINLVRELRLDPHSYKYSLHGKSFEKFHSVETLQLIGGGITFLPQEMFRDMRNLSRLIIVSNNVQFQDETFKYVPNLRFLEIIKSILTRLETGAFTFVRNLEYLMVDQTILHKFSKNFFSNFPHLKNLVLRKNEFYMEELPSGIFDNLKNLQIVEFVHNKFYPFLSNRTRQLKLSRRDEISIILSHGAFSNLPLLENVTLDDNRISALSGDTFKNSSNVKSLVLTNNELKTLPEDVFADLVRLERLDLSENLITDLPDKLFSNNKNLLILHLNSNKLQHIQKDLFGELVQLRELNLRENRLRAVSGEQFVNLRSLEKLDMSGNQLSTLLMDHSLREYDHSVLFHCKRLRELYLTDNSLTEIYEDWRLELVSLKYIFMDRNNFSSIETTDCLFSGRQVYFTLTSNNISLVDFGNTDSTEEALKDGSLNIYRSTVRLDDNPLHCDCALEPFLRFITENSVDGLQQFVHTSVDPTEETCSKSGLLRTTLAEALTTLPNCTAKVEQCPSPCRCRYREFSNSWVVNCQNSRLERPPSILPLGRGDHTELNLYNNRLQGFQVADGAGYERVTHINLSHNNISTLNLTGLSDMLQVVDVSNNQLERLSEEVLETLEKAAGLERLEVHGNPWQCDSERLLRLFHNKKHLMRSLLKITCSDGKPYHPPPHLSPPNMPLSPPLKTSIPSPPPTDP